MKIGFSSIYGWRPHVEHMSYLAGIIREAGHSVSFLACDSDISTCYNNELHFERPKFLNCAFCRIGGIRSFERDNVDGVRDLIRKNAISFENLSDWCKSSASTLGRFESDDDYASLEFQTLTDRLNEPTKKIFAAALQWIEKNRLDAVCVFNGRMDVTRAVLEAASKSGVPYVSMERTWFGDGIQLLPGENCIGLKNIDQMTAKWRDHPIDFFQAIKAAKPIAARFLRKNTNEWRAYNIRAEQRDWPIKGAKLKLLILPSSRNETWGHSDWHEQWPERTIAFDAVIDHLKLNSSDLVLRCHPSWSERIGNNKGENSEQLYIDWAKKRGIHCIPSHNLTSTLRLIEICDAIIVNGSSSALEAAPLGKQVISLSPSAYQRAGFQTDATSPSKLMNAKLNINLNQEEQKFYKNEIARKALRYLYTMAYRLPQYVDYVRCIQTTHYKYFDGADPSQFLNLISSGKLCADDNLYAMNEIGEDKVLEIIEARDWQKIFNMSIKSIQSNYRPILRRFPYKYFDKLRDVFPRGDL